MTDHKEMKVNRFPLYFGKEDKPVFGWLHLPKSNRVLNKAIIICQPLALDYMSAYRSMRYLADYFASEGFACLRFDYYGTGDSGGYTEQDSTIQDAAYSVTQAIAWLNLHCPVTAFSLVGFRFGASIAALVSQDYEVEELALWAPIDNGKRYLREIKALQAASHSIPQASSSSQAERLEAAGMVYWPNTQTQLAELEFENLKPMANRITVIPRDDAKRQPKFIDTWLKQEFPVELMRLPGSSDMLKLAEDTRVPHQSFQQLVSNLRKPPGATIDLTSTVRQLENVETKGLRQHTKCSLGYIHPEYLDYSATKSETPSKVIECVLQSKSSNLLAILTKTGDNGVSHRPCVVLLNSGAIHRVGSNRLHVLLARQLAGKGFPCLRMDIPGLGDSISGSPELENKEHLPDIEPYVYEMIDLLKRQGYKKFIVAGLSSGAFYAYNAILRNQDDAIIDSLIINPEQFYVAEASAETVNLAEQEGGWLYYSQQLKNPQKWKKLISGKVNFRYINKIIAGKARSVAKKLTNQMSRRQLNNVDSIQDELSHDLLYIAQNNRKITFVLSEQDPANEIIKLLGGQSISKLEARGSLKRIRIPGADHTFSKYVPMIRMINSVTEYLEEQYAEGTSHE